MYSTDSFVSIPILWRQMGVKWEPGQKSMMLSFTNSELLWLRVLIPGVIFLFNVGCWQRANVGGEDDSGTQNLCGGGECAAGGDSALLFSDSVVNASSDTGEADTAMVGDTETAPLVVGTETVTDTLGADELDSVGILTANLHMGTFDPGEVYVIGSMWDSATFFGVIAPIRNLNTGIAGFERSLVGYSYGISPDGRMYYADFDNFLWFECDGCPDWRPEGSPWDIYPSDATANDGVIDIHCANATKAGRAHIGANGTFLFWCYDEIWYTEDGTPTIVDFPVSYGYDNKVLNYASDTESFSVIDIATGTTVICSDEAGNPLEPVGWTARATDSPKGFLFATMSRDFVRILWHIDNEGNVSKQGEYPSRPEDFKPTGVDALDAQGGLYVRGYALSDSSIDKIVYYNIDGTVEVIWSDLDDPIVEILTTKFLTGP